MKRELKDIQEEFVIVFCALETGRAEQNAGEAREIFNVISSNNGLIQLLMEGYSAKTVKNYADNLADALKKND